LHYYKVNIIKTHHKTANNRSFTTWSSHEVIISDFNYVRSIAANNKRLELSANSIVGGVHLNYLPPLPRGGTSSGTNP